MSKEAAIVIGLLEKCLADEIEAEALHAALGETEYLSFARLSKPLQATLKNAIHFMYHYEVDADIRARDQGYKEIQKSELAAFRSEILSLDEDLSAS